jgi:hypothetical protein
MPFTMIGAAGASAPAAPTPVVTTDPHTVFDADFTAGAAANLLTGGDGIKTVAGIPLNMTGLALGSAVDVVPGTGIRMTVNATSNQFGFRPVLGTIEAGADRYRGQALQWDVQFSLSAWATPNELVMVQFRDETAGERIRGGFYHNGGQKAFFGRADPPGSVVTWPENIGSNDLTDDVLSIIVRSATYAEFWTGTYSGGWPTSMTLRGHRTHALQQSSWIAKTSLMGVAIWYYTPGASTGRIFTIKRARLRWI